MEKRDAGVQAHAQVRQLRLYTLLLGWLSWALIVALPLLYRAAHQDWAQWVLAALPPIALTGGLWVEGRQRPSATYILMTGFPLCLALPLARLEHGLSLRTYTPLTLLICTASLAAYCGALSSLCASRLALRDARTRPLGEVAELDGQTRRQRIARWVLGAVGLALAALAPVASWGSEAGYREHWGDAAAAGATLTALMAGLIGAVAVAAIVAPALRASREKPPSAAAIRRRVAWLTTVAASGLLVYFLLLAAR